MTVSMKEEEEEVIDNERPESYYRAIYTEKEQSQFAQAALTAEAIFAELNLPAIDAWPLKVMSLEKHNQQVEKEKLRHRKRRPGMKKRSNIIVCRERRILREKEEKKARREAQAKYKKNVYKKFKGGRVDKKPVKQVAKPKYRTE